MGEVGVGARTKEAEAEAKVEVTHTAVREVDLTLPTILEAVPDRSHITRALEASWTNDESRAHGNDRCPITGRPQVHLPPRPRVEHRRALQHRPGQRRGQAVENRIPPVMISSICSIVLFLQLSNAHVQNLVKNRLENLQFRET